MTGFASRSLSGRLREISQRLARDTSGLALIEFAFAAPLVLGMGMLGTDTAYLVITHMQISQIAMQVADNASRVGEQDVLTARKIYERDITEALTGAEKLGQNLDFYSNARVIVSSLQQNAQGGQWIAWQRCRGAARHNSSYGVEDDGKTGKSFAGMGEPGRYITASPGTAVMFVEVAFDYEPITPVTVFEGRRITYTAAFNVRDNRDLTGGPKKNGMYNEGPVAKCAVFSANRPI
ncbi:TadE/TadG family type IV pilus assembly protein [Erythrobacter sp. R86502]|uniref:TadE/TadG family type IV pilus assembly protein n=1 Tax=Erythrobacter sp. R86502 TaxID=3093846 RepID=UPI0036D3F713